MKSPAPTKPIASIATQLVTYSLLAGLVLSALTNAVAQTRPDSVSVKDGVVQPRRPLPEAMADAMQFLRKADGAYVPGRLDGELAGYFSSAHVNPDGTRSSRRLAYPGRQHAYFIFTFLRHYAYSGEREWLQRARDLADWNIAHSTPTNAVYADVPYSTFLNGKPGGSRDVDALTMAYINKGDGFLIDFIRLEADK